jgi:hypothetical protein
MKQEHTWHLDNFVVHDVLGLNFEVHSKRTSIDSSLMTEQMNQSGGNIAKSFNSLLTLDRLINDKDALDLVKVWAKDLVPCMRTKVEAMKVFLTYMYAVENQGQSIANFELVKHVDKIRCNLSWHKSNQRNQGSFIETLTLYGQTRQYRHNDISCILWLDYFNNVNFEFK